MYMYILITNTDIRYRTNSANGTRNVHRFTDKTYVFERLSRLLSKQLFDIERLTVVIVNCSRKIYIFLNVLTFLKIGGKYLRFMGGGGKIYGPCVDMNRKGMAKTS